MVIPVDALLDAHKHPPAFFKRVIRMKAAAKRYNYWGKESLRNYHR